MSGYEKEFAVVYFFLSVHRFLAAFTELNYKFHILHIQNTGCQNFTVHYNYGSSLINAFVIDPFT